MRHNYIVFLIGIMLLVVTLTACQAQGGIAPGDRAPEISASSWYNSSGVTLESLRGKVVVVEFWATWCPPCRASIPHLNDVHDSYRDQGVVIIGLSKEDSSKVESFVKKMDMRYIVGAGSNSGKEYGVRGIPHAFIVNPDGGIAWHGHPMAGLEAALDEVLTVNPPTAKEPAAGSSTRDGSGTRGEEPRGSETKKGTTMNPTVIMETSKGSITIELWPDKAPITVKNFLRYVDEGFYDGTIFHRVISNFMIQGGGFTPDMNQKAAHDPIKNEARADVGNKRGTLAMARTNIVDSATAQFFINVVDNDFLTHKSKTPRGYGYCVFGKVTGGMDVVNEIKQVKTGRNGPYQDVPATPVVIKKVERSE